MASAPLSKEKCEGQGCGFITHLSASVNLQIKKDNILPFLYFYFSFGMFNMHIILLIEIKKKKKCTSCLKRRKYIECSRWQYYESHKTHWHACDSTCQWVSSSCMWCFFFFIAGRYCLFGMCVTPKLN